MRKVTSFSRGLISAVIAIIIFSVTIVSCKKDQLTPEEKKHASLLKFEKVLKESMPVLAKYANSIKNSESVVIKSSAVSSIPSLLKKSSEVSNQELFFVPEELNALLSASIDLLETTEYYSDVLNAFGTEDGRMILSAALIYDYETSTNQLTTNGLDSREVGTCIAEAFGISLGIEILAGRLANMSARAVIAAVAKVVARHLSAIGWAWGIYHFGTCMIQEYQD